MANENDVEVKFGAETSGLTDGFAKAKDEVQKGADGIAEGTTVATAAAVALGNAFEKIAEKIVEFAHEAVQEAIHAFSDLGGAIEHMQHRLGGSAEGLSQLKLGLESVGLSTQTYEAIARRLPQVLEQHAEQFKAAGVAYTDANGNLLPVQETITNITEHLNGFTAGAARNTEGVRLLGRAYFNMADTVEITKARMEEASKVATEFGLVLTEKDLEAANEFERQTKLTSEAVHGFWVELSSYLTPLLTELAVNLRDSLVPVFQVFREVVGTFSTTVLVTAMEAAEDIFSAVWEAVQALGEVFKEVFSVIGDLINSVFGSGGDGVTAMEFFKNTLILVQIAIIGFKNGVVVTLTIVTGMLEQLVATLKLFAGVATAAFRLDWDGVKAAWSKGMADLDNIARQSGEKIIAASNKSREQIEAALAGGGSTRKNAGTPAAEANAPDPNKGKLTSGQFAIADAESARLLALEKQRLAELSAVNEDSHKHDLETEQAYWQNKLQIVQSGIDAEMAKLRRDLAEARQQMSLDKDDPEKRRAAQAKEIGIVTQLMVLEKQRAEAEKQNQREMTDAIAKRNAALSVTGATGVKQQADADVAAESAKNAQMEALRQIDAASALDLQAQEEEKSYAAEVNFLEAKKQAALATSSDVEQTLADARNASEKSERDHQSRMTAISNKAALERAKYSIQAQQSVQTAFGSMVFDLTDGVKKLSDVFRSFALNVAHAFQNVIAQRFAEKIVGPGTGIGNMMDKFVNIVVGGVDKIVSMFISGEAAKTSATAAGTAARTAAETAASSESLASQAGTVIAQIWNFAASTFAAVFQALAGIPYIGPFLAAAAAPAAMATVGAVAGSVKSSAGGDWKVDSDRLNMVHKDETILPAPISESMRNFFEGGGGGGGVNLSVNAIDGASVKRFFFDNGNHLASSLKQQARNFSPTGAR